MVPGFNVQYVEVYIHETGFKGNEQVIIMDSIHLQ